MHTQALLLAGDEARLRLLVNDMFETMSRRNRTLVDQQLALIDRLERNEENPDRLDSLFRLDHLAARLRRNSANLLVLAGAQLARDQRDPVPLATVINAAVSEVEDYRRVELAGMPDCALIGAAAGGAIHLFAELIDNALRYSPPTTSARVSASRGGDGGVVVRIADAGLGMNDADRRMANMRLQAGGDVSPDNARHMGLFVVGRIAARHGIRVGLRGPAANESGSGTTAEIYLPPAVLAGLAVAESAPPRHIRAVSTSSAKLARANAADADDTGQADGPQEPAARTAPDASGPSVTLLPRRNPGSSGITEVPAPPGEQQPRRQRRELATPWWESTPKPAPEPKPAAEPAPAEHDVIYRRMLSEMLGDPHDLVNSPDLDWQSVWDRGWTLAAAADEKPVEAHTTDHGLPVRTPGARLVPGNANGAEQDEPAEPDHGVNGRSHRKPQHAANGRLARDPEAVRASFSNHFGGVRTGRSHARETDQGSDQQ